METFTFRIQGSQEEPYEVAISLSEEALKITCTCKAGSVGQFCKHKMSVLNGDTSALAERGKDDIQGIPKLVYNTEAINVIKKIEDAEKDIEALKKSQTLLKKYLARITS